MGFAIKVLGLYGYRVLKGLGFNFMSKVLGLNLGLGFKLLN